MMIQCQKDQKALFLRVKTQFHFVYTNINVKNVYVKQIHIKST